MNTLLKTNAKKKDKQEYVEVEMTLAEFAKTYMNISNFSTEEIETIPIDDLGVLIESYDVNKKETCFKTLDSFILKPAVDKHYILESESGEILKTSAEHRIWDGETWIESRNIGKLIDEKLEIVDVSVQDTECYIANGQINHNTTGGNATKFAASVRIRLQGKTPIVESDPFAQANYEMEIAQWNTNVKTWKENGSVGPKPEKPKKEKGDEIIVGYDVTARTDKNKVGPPRREAEFRIVFSKGIIEEEAWFDYSLKYNLIKKVSGFEYEFVKHPELGKFKRDGWTDMLSDAELHEEIKQAIVGKLVRSVEALEAVPGEFPTDEEQEEPIEETKIE